MGDKQLSYLWQARRYCTTTLWRLVNDRLILIDFVTGSASMHINFRRGMRLPSLIGAMGRCVAGDMLDDPQKIARAFSQLDWQNAPSLCTYMRDAQQAKMQGWAMDIDLYVQGLTIVAAPIRDHKSKIVFSVANVLLSGPKRKTERERLGEAIRSVAQKASGKLNQ